MSWTHAPDPPAIGPFTRLIAGLQRANMQDRTARQ